MSNRSRGKRGAEPYRWMRKAQANADQHANDDGVTPEQFSSAEYMSIQWPAAPDAPPGAPAIHLSVAMTNKRIVYPSGLAKFDYAPTEDSIHPYPLKFDPPLREFGASTSTGFQRYWEKLTLVFDLPNPSDFPQVELRPEDRILTERFVRTAQRLAGYALINQDAALSVGKSNGVVTVKLFDPPSDESFVAASAIFRQLHNDRETASFSSAYNALLRVISALPEDEQASIKPVAVAWMKARGKLMNRTLQTLTTIKATNAPPDAPVSFLNIKPDELIKQFNYGDSLHFNADNGLVDLRADNRHEAYYTYAAMISILGLSHLYFGFAVLLEHALGGLS